MFFSLIIRSRQSLHQENKDHFPDHSHQQNNKYLRVNNNFSQLTFKSILYYFYQSSLYILTLGKMQFKHKMKLFLNDPSFKRHKNEWSRSQRPKQQVYKNVFPTKLQIERFRHLQQARINTMQDMHLDKNVQHCITKMQEALHKYHSKNQELEKKKQSFFGKFKMDYVQVEMNQNLQDLGKLVARHEQLHQLIQQEKNSVQKSLRMTEIRKALKIQNELLKSQNENLKKQEQRLDNYIANLKK